MDKEQTTNRLLRMPTVQQITLLSRTEIYRRMKAGTFPKPLKLGVRSIAFRATDIENWLKNLTKECGK